MKVISILKNILLPALVIFIISAPCQSALLLRQPSIELYLEKGQVFNGGVILENTSDSAIDVTAGMVNSLDKDGKPAKYSCSKWTKIEEEKFSIPPKSIKDLRFRTAVPQDAKGGYSSGLLYSYRTSTVQGPSDITLNINMNIEMPFRVSVKGTADHAMSVKSFDAKCSSEVLTISSKVKNTGNTFQDVRATFLVLGPDGKLLDTLKAGSFMTYPDEEYNIDYSGKTDLPKGNVKMLGLFDYGADKIKTEEKVFNVE
ncbi:MAG: hypothetical protein NTZ10_05400 [Candidatus Saganbacteria bacterium]|nr:hypothetical protein [Candidatus Saganbacteria bacterium]